MANNGNVSEFTSRNTANPSGRASGLHPLHEAAMKLAGMGLNRSHTKTRDLVAMLLGHGARAWRASQPVVSLHLHVKTPAGAHPIRMRLR
jgi:hypothetical protein